MTNPLSAYASSAFSYVSSHASSAYASLPSVSTPEFVKRGGQYIGDSVEWTQKAIKPHVPDWFPFGGYLSSAATSCGTWIDAAVKRLGFEGGISGISKLWQKAAV